MTILFASSNKNKIREINSLLAGRHSVLGLEEAGIIEEIPETGSTLKENSLLKAQFVIDHVGIQSPFDAVFADDSGLEVGALNGAPGVYSARYAGVPKNDELNNIKLLEELRLITNRRARFATVITLIMKGEVHYFEGEIKGTIAHEQRGKNGFGYDPLFIPRGYRSTFAELSGETKNAISHRALAVNKMVKFLENF